MACIGFEEAGIVIQGSDFEQVKMVPVGDAFFAGDPLTLFQHIQGMGNVMVCKIRAEVLQLPEYPGLDAIKIVFGHAGWLGKSIRR